MCHLWLMVTLGFATIISSLLHHQFQWENREMKDGNLAGQHELEKTAENRAGMS